MVAFFSLLGQGCIQLHALSQVCGGAIYRAWQPFRRRSETPWLSSSKCGSTLVIRLRLCVFMQTQVKPLLELTLPKGELPSPCDQLPEGAPEGIPNRRVKAFIMGAISYDVPTRRLSGSNRSQSGDRGIKGTTSTLSDCLSLGALTCVVWGFLSSLVNG